MAKRSTLRTAAKEVARAQRQTDPRAPTPTTVDTSTNNGKPQPEGISGSWKMLLNSEFTGSSLDTSVWRTGWYDSSAPSGPVNANETDCYSPGNVSFPGDGTMHLSVTHSSSRCDGGTEPWTGAIVTTNPNDGRASGGFQYTYGVAEARVFIPADGSKIANWPAFWTDGKSWPADGEDDILESIDGRVCSTFHDPAGAPRTCASVTPGWHTFASDWKPGSITYYYDGVDVGTVTQGVTSAPMYLILDNAVDSTDYTNNAPDAMQVQYVRVWQAA